MKASTMLLDQNTQRHVDLCATQAPATGPMTGPSKGAREYNATAFPRSSGRQQSPSTPPPIWLIDVRGYTLRGELRIAH